MLRHHFIIKILQENQHKKIPHCLSKQQFHRKKDSKKGKNEKPFKDAAC
jgi:hypothetical protein